MSDELPGALELTINVEKQVWPHTMDAAIWAAEFKKLYPESDEEVMLGWFANAIMAGYDIANFHRSQAEREVVSPDPDAIPRAWWDELNKELVCIFTRAEREEWSPGYIHYKLGVAMQEIESRGKRDE